jgi:hypothetical protein
MGAEGLRRAAKGGEGRRREARTRNSYEEQSFGRLRTADQAKQFVAGVRRIVQLVKMLYKSAAIVT